MSQPLVSVVTPVYNGERYLAKCIESILEQTYQNWEYVIVNNCSTDRSLKIAENYAEHDKRIIIYNNKDFLELIENWNHALQQISYESKYCKVVHADDWLYPECIEQMVNIAEIKPKISIVGSYILKGTEVVGTGLQYPMKIFSGKEICRLTLIRELYVFGSPTSILIRSNLIKGNKNFYDSNFFHADKEVCLRILQDSEFGFVHQILSYTRLHKESQTDIVAKKNNTSKMENICFLLKYGTIYFDKDEYAKIKKQKLKSYYRFLAKNSFSLKGMKLLKYQKKGLEKVGYSLSMIKLILAFILEVIDKIFNPKKTFSQFLSFVFKNTDLKKLI